MEGSREQVLGSKDPRLPKEVSEKLAFYLLLLCGMLAYVAFYGGYWAHAKCTSGMFAVVLLLFPVLVPIMFVTVAALRMFWLIFNGKLEAARADLIDFRDLLMDYYQSSSRLSVAYVVLLVCAIYSLYFRYEVVPVFPPRSGGTFITITDRLTGQAHTVLYEDNCPDSQP